MMISYPLPDKLIFDACFSDVHEGNFCLSGESRFFSFVPHACYVSLGASNSLETSVNVHNCQRDGVSVFQRLSGGEAVYLSPNCVVYSAVIMAGKLPSSADFFALNLQWIASSLKQLGVQNVQRRGISDLAIAERKILGCAIYRRIQVMIFQAVLNVCEAPENIERYLLHPVREPDYRKAREHSQFVTSLHLQGYSINPHIVAAQLNKQQF